MKELIQWSAREENYVNLDELEPGSPFTLQFMEEYLERLYAGMITQNKLDPAYHATTGGHLYKAVSQGFGGTADQFSQTSSAFKTIEGLRDNVYIFSAAKQYQQVRIMSAFINIKGEKSTWPEFKSLASKVFDEFNTNYLKTEYRTAVGQSQMARDWVEFQEHKDQFPIIQYKTQGDGRVRDAHAMLNNIKRNIDDPFWNSYMPKNGWRCRCFTVALPPQKETDLSKKNIPAFGTKDFPEVFKMNPGKDMEVFKKDHPYFSVPNRDKSFKKDNFGMKIPGNG